MTIGAIGAAASSALSNPAPISSTGLSSAGKVGGTEGSKGFGDMMTKALDSLQETQSKSDNLATKAATGDLTDIHDYMIASSEATMATQLTVAVRNKAVEAFNDIMRMSL